MTRSRLICGVSALVLLAATSALANPTGGTVVDGTATITGEGTATVTVTGGSSVINWASFSNTLGETVQFNLSTSAISVNRVTGPSPSVIAGVIQGVGNIILINPNGVAITPTGQINLTRFAASTSDISTFCATCGGVAGDNYIHFDVPSPPALNAVITNDGAIQVSSGGAITLQAAQVTNTGTLTAPNGAVALTGADWMSTTLLSQPENFGTSYARAHTVSNSGTVTADGGAIHLQTGGFTGPVSPTFPGTVVSTGTLRARGAAGCTDPNCGFVGIDAQNVNLSAGTVDVTSAGAAGGVFRVYASGAISIDDGVTVLTQSSAPGAPGLADFTQSTFNLGLNFSLARLESLLAQGDVDLWSRGTFRVSTPLTWSAHHLRLSAGTDLFIDEAISATGTSRVTLGDGRVMIPPGSGARFLEYYGTYFQPSADGRGYIGRLDFGGRTGAGLLTINNDAYTVIDSLAALQDIGSAGNLSTHYALAADVDATATSTWNGGAGFAPIRNYNGTFYGLGHIISNLKIDRPTEDQVGLFGSINWTYGQSIYAPFRILGVTLSDASVTGRDYVGGLLGASLLSGSPIIGDGSFGTFAGRTGAHISGSAVFGTVAGRSYVGGAGGLSGGLRIMGATTVSASGTGDVYLGGLFGVGGLELANASVSVSAGAGARRVGGLVGMGNLAGSEAGGVVTVGDGAVNVGGLVGLATASSGVGRQVNGNDYVSNSNSAVTVSAGAGSTNVGGVAGQSYAGVAGNTAIANVTVGAGSRYVGGVVGLAGFSRNDTAPYTTITAPGGLYVGGLIGKGSAMGGLRPGGVVSAAGGQYVGGIAGQGYTDGGNSSGLVVGAYDVGGLSGQGEVSNSYSDATVNGVDRVGGASGNGFVDHTQTNSRVTGVNRVGGLAGQGGALESWANSSVDATGGAVGGVVGYQTYWVTRSWASGSVSGLYNVGGVVGEATGTTAIYESYFEGATVDGFHQVGGLVGRTNVGPGTSFYGRVVNSFYNADTVLINGAHQITVGGLYSGQYIDWIADKTLNIGDYFTQSGGDYIVDSPDAFRAMLGFVNPATSHTVRPVRFRLTNDIDLTSPPAGSSVAFTWLPELWVQSLDGGGHTVRVNINQDPSRVLPNDMMGLVGQQPSGSTLSNLVVAGAVHGVNAQGLGGAVGATQGVVQSVTASGIVVTAADDVSNADFSALTVPQYRTSDGATYPTWDQFRYIPRFTGGLVGFSMGTLSGLSGSGSVTSDGDRVGGIVGEMFRTGPGDSFAFSGPVTGRDLVGGVIGNAFFIIPAGRVYKGFSHAGDVTGRDGVGGIMGRLQIISSNDLGAYSFEDFVSTGTVRGAGRVGGVFGEGGTGIYDLNISPGSFAAYEPAYAIFRRMRFTGDVEGIYDRVGGIAGDFGFGLSFSAPWATLGHVMGRDYVGGVSGDGYDEEDAVVEGAGGALATISGRNYVGGAAGSESFSDRAVVRARVTGQDYVGGVVGGDANQVRQSTVLADVAGRDYVGGVFGSGWQGWDLKVLSGSVIQGRDYVGGVAGSGEVTRGSAVAVVSGVNRVGGLLGSGTAFSSAAAGTVTGQDQVGGLAGQGYVVESFALSNVIGNDWVGGLVGEGSAFTSFAETTVNGRNHVGGLLGAGSARDSYATGTVTGVDYVGGLIGGGPPGAAPAPIPGLPDPVPSTGSSATGSYADVAVTGVTHVGGFSGGADPVLLVDYYDDPFDDPDLGVDAYSYYSTYGNFWNAAKNPGLPGDGQVTAHAGMTGLSDMTRMTAYTTLDTGVDPAATVPWSVTSTPNDPNPTTWRIYEGLSAPLLRVFMAPLEVTAAPVTKVYDGLPFAGSSAYALGAVAADAWRPAGAATPSLVVGRLDSAGVNAGVYNDLSIARANLNGVYSRQAALVGGEIRLGYDLYGAPSTLTITAAGLKVLGTSGTKTYDGSAIFDASRLTLSGVLAGDVVNLSGQARTASADVGVYLSWASSSLVLDNPNYTLAGGAVMATISPASLVLAANGASKIYGDVLVFSGTEFTASGLVNGESVGGVRLSSPGASATAPVGGYPILISNATGGTFNPANYSLSYVNGLLSVTARPVTVLGVSGTRRYDGTTLFEAPLLSLSGVLAGDVVRLSGQAHTAGADVGTYLSWATSTLRLDNPNYTLEGGTVRAVITPAPLLVTANGASKAYGDLLAFDGTEFTASGLVAGETVGGVQLASEGASARAGAGIYALRVSGATGGTFRPSNYAITYQDGVLSVRPRVIGVAGTRVYDGTSLFRASGLSLSGVLVGDEVTLSGQAEAGGPHTGDYTRWAVSSLALSSPNYTLEGGSVLATITPATLVVTAADAVKPFGQTLSFTGREFTASGLVAGETIGRVDLASAGAPASAIPGVYAIRASAASGGTFRSADYRIVYVDGRLAVDRPVLPPSFPDDPLEMSGGGGFLTFANGAAMDPARPLSKVEYDPLDEDDLLGWIEGYIADTALAETSEATGILEYKRLSVEIPYPVWRSRRAGVR